MKKSEQSPDQREDVLRRATARAVAPSPEPGVVPDERVGPDALSSVLDLDGAETLARIRAGRRTAWRVEADQMVAATHWADLHRLPVPDDDDACPAYGSVSADTARLLGDGVNGTEGMTWATTPSGGAGTDPTAERGPGSAGHRGGAPVPGGGRLPGPGVRRHRAGHHAGDDRARSPVLPGRALECRDRLPRIWAQVLAGAVPAWKARQIAQLTLPLNAAAAPFVDLSLHRVAGRIGIVRITRAVEAAILRHDPDLAEEQAARAAERRGVWVGPDRGSIEDADGRNGLARIDALVDTPDAEAFELAVADIAGALGTLGDDDPLPVRRAKAVGILADPRHALDVAVAAQTDPAVDPETGRARRRPRRRGPVTGRSMVIDLHLHLTPTECSDRSRRAEGTAGTGTGTTPTCPVGPVVRDGHLRPVSRAAAERWLSQLAPGAPIRVRPVLDLAGGVAVDAHEVPQAIADQVDERDLTCQFPWCGRPARPGTTDRDHIEPYVPPDEGGPPGQTSAPRLARLCRYHHRVKTHGGWRYRRDPDDGLTW